MSLGFTKRLKATFYSTLLIYVLDNLSLFWSEGNCLAGIVPCHTFNDLALYVIVGTITAIIVYESFKSLKDDHGFSAWVARLIMTIVLSELTLNFQTYFLYIQLNRDWLKNLYILLDWNIEAFANFSIWRNTAIRVIIYIWFVSTMTKLVGYPKHQIGFHEPTSVPNASQTTRRILAALVSDKKLRRDIINFVEQERIARAPELGIDFGQIVEVCSLLNERKVLFDIFYFFVAISVGIVIPMILNEIGIIVFILVAASLRFLDILIPKYYFLPLLQSQNYTPDEFLMYLRGKGSYLAKYNANLTRANLNKEQNVVVYDAFSPFVGAGIPLDTWSLNVDCGNAREQLDRIEIKEFQLTDLYEHIEEYVQKHGNKNSSVNDYLFINGRDIWNKRWILPDVQNSPISHINDGKMLEYMVDDNNIARYYKWFKLYDWGNEIILSHLLHLSRQGDYLFIEIHRYLLPPLADRYRRIDMFETSNTDIIGDILACLVIGPLVCFWRSLVNGIWLLWKFLKLFNNESDDIKEIHRQRDFNFGARNTFREQISTTKLEHLFQKLDIQYHIKLIDAGIMDAINEFLEARNIDTSEFSKRRQTILNEGVVIQGGDLQADTIAVGKNAQSHSAQSGFIAKSIQTYQGSALQKNVSHIQSTLQRENVRD